MRGFGSDNHAPTHPRILEALLQVNSGHLPSYGTDELTHKCETQFQDLFGSSNLKSFFVFNGTGANVVALRALAKPWQAVLCSDVSHINLDECGAPEALGGFKLQTVPSHQGKITIEELEKAFIRRGDQHYSQAAVLSITQPTELGTVYSETEFAALCQWAQKKKLKIHVDGARIANAIWSLKTTFAKHITENKVDILSFGGTKNGLLMGEAVLVLNPEVSQDVRYLRKQTAQLPSKSRYFAAQFSTYLEDNLWAEIAGHSCLMAKELYNRIPKELCLSAPESNAVFVYLKPEWIKQLKEVSFFYVWDEHTHLSRLMTSWDTQLEEIENFTQKLKRFME